jgi:hypothetical protein
MRLRNREEYWTGRTARKRHQCESSAARCDDRYIEPGARYIEMSLPPNSDMGNADWWRVKACLKCATAFNRELVDRLFPPTAVMA